MKFFHRNKTSGATSVYGMTDVGMKRVGNEDAYLIFPEKQFYIVSDGMGGHNAGEVASKTALKAIETFFANIDISTIPENLIPDTMAGAVFAANKEVWDKSRSMPEYSGMGCTLAMVFLDKNMLHVCHIGDSRVYVIDHKEIIQITMDHSVVMELVKAGQISKEEARKSTLKNQLTRALGISSEANLEYTKQQVKMGDTILLCTDGPWDMLTDDEIYTVVKKGGIPEQCCSRLIRMANDAGGDDNITVIVARITG